MFRSIRLLLAVPALATLVFASFTGGRHLRKVAAAPLVPSARISSRSESGLAGTVEVAPAIDLPDDAPPGEIFQEVYKYIKSEYVDKVEDDRRLGQWAVRSMLLSLDDPSAGYYDPGQLKRLKERMNGTFKGIGATVRVTKQHRNGIDQRRLTVVAPVPGSPAEKAGMRPGDVITHVDGRWVIAYSPRMAFDPEEAQASSSKQGSSSADERRRMKDVSKRFNEGITALTARQRMGADDGKSLTLTIERPGASQPIKVAVTTATTDLAPAEYKRLGDKAGYLRITLFNDRATEIIKQALKSAPGYLIVDLRDNVGMPVPAGRVVPASAEALLGGLTRGGRVATLIRKSNQREAVQIASGSSHPFRIAVLVNAGTASIAELVASALKERGGATLIGQRTFGDATWTKLIMLRDGAAMTIGAGRFLSASGFDWNAKGIQPDQVLPTGGPRSDGDAATQRALSVLGA